MATTTDRMLGIAEAEKRLGLRRKTMVELITEGHLPAYRMHPGRPNSHYRIRESDLETFLESRRVVPEVGDAP